MFRRKKNPPVTRGVYEELQETRERLQNLEEQQSQATRQAIQYRIASEEAQTALNTANQNIANLQIERDTAQALATEEVGRLNELENEVQLLRVRSRADEKFARSAGRLAADADRRAAEADRRARADAEALAEAETRANTESQRRQRLEQEAERNLNQAIKAGGKLVIKVTEAENRVNAAENRVNELTAQIEQVRAQEAANARAAQGRVAAAQGRLEAADAARLELAQNAANLERERDTERENLRIARTEATQALDAQTLAEQRANEANTELQRIRETRAQEIQNAVRTNRERLIAANAANNQNNEILIRAREALARAQNVAITTLQNADNCDGDAADVNLQSIYTAREYIIARRENLNRDADNYNSISGNIGEAVTLANFAVDTAQQAADRATSPNCVRIDEAVAREEFENTQNLLDQERLRAQNAEAEAIRNAEDAAITRETEAKNKRLTITIIAIIVALIASGTVAIIFGAKNKQNFLWITGIIVVSLAILGGLFYFINYFKSKAESGLRASKSVLGLGYNKVGGVLAAGAGKVKPGFTIGNTATTFETPFKVIFGGLASILLAGGIVLLFTGIRNNTAEFNTAGIGCLVAGAFTLLTIIFAFNTPVIQKNFTQIILIHIVLVAAIIFTLLGFAEDSQGQEQSNTLWGFAGVGIGLFVLFIIGFATFYYLNRGSAFKSIFMQNFYNIFAIFLLAAAFTAGISMLIITLTTDNNEHLAIPSAILIILGCVGTIIANKYIKFSTS